MSVLELISQHTKIKRKFKYFKTKYLDTTNASQHNRKVNTHRSYAGSIAGDV